MLLRQAAQKQEERQSKSAGPLKERFDMLPTALRRLAAAALVPGSPSPTALRPPGAGALRRAAGRSFSPAVRLKTNLSSGSCRPALARMSLRTRIPAASGLALLVCF
ncbi:MAG: hypothetical protein WKG07_22385 [Hymenobacter sp.]